MSTEDHDNQKKHEETGTDQESGGGESAQEEQFGEVVHPNQGWGTDYEGDFSEDQGGTEASGPSAGEKEYTDVEEIEPVTADSANEEDFPADDFDEDYGTPFDDDEADLSLEDEADDIEFATEPRAKKSPLPIAVVFVVIVLAGLGGFVAMNPDLLNMFTGGQTSQAPTRTAGTQPPVRPAAPQKTDVRDQGSETDGFEPEIDLAGLPQPTVNQNTVNEPRGPVAVSAPVPELPAASTSNEELPAGGTERLSAKKDNALTEGADDVIEQGSAPGEIDFSVNDTGRSDLQEAGRLSPKAEQNNDTSLSLAQRMETGSAPSTQTQAVSSGQNSNNAAAPQAQGQADAVPVSGEVLTPRPLPTDNEQDNSAPGAGAANSDFYDSENVLPPARTINRGGPRMMDPRSQPASRLIVIEKNFEANDQESMLVAANRALKLGRYESAVDMFEKLYEKSPTDPRILMGRAIALQKTNRVESAIHTYEELLEVDPDNTNALINMLGLLKSQYPSVALRRLIELHNQYPNHAGIAAQVGVTQAEMGHYDDAMRFLGIAVSIEPDNPMHYMNMAVIADRQMKVDDAIELYQKALEIDAVHNAARVVPRDQVYDRLSVLRRRQSR